ncbi:MAG: ECF transporter S component [Clostridiales bacterium]|nr:ECF transporter S component [Clostridiales bacterium]
MNSRYFSSHRITAFSILLALVIVLQALGATINIGAVQLNFTLVPIVLGAIMLGAVAGAVLGFACGVVVLIQVIMGLVPFYTLIWTETPLITTLTCIVKTTAAGYLAGLAFKIVKKKNMHVAVFVAAAIVPIVNTGLFIVGCLGMWDAIATMAGGSNVFGFILVSLVTFNFFIELLVNILVSPALYRVVRVLGKDAFDYEQTDMEDEQTETFESEE